MAVKEALENATVALINKTVTGIDTAVNFLSTEIPEVIKQLLMWNFTLHFVWAVCGFILLLAVITHWIIANKSYKLTKNSDDFFAPFMVSIFVGIPGIIMFMTNMLQSIKIWIAPKVWLIEYAAELAKKVSN